MAHQMMSTLFKLKEKAIAAGNPSIIVEAGHFYGDHGVDDGVLEGVQYAMGIIEYMQNDVSLKRMLFIDDVGNHGDGEQVVDNIRYGIAAIASLGFVPDQIILETQLVPSSRIALSDLITDGKVKSQKIKVDFARDHNASSYGFRDMLKDGWLPLTGKAGIQDHPSCSLIDAVLYKQKLEVHGGAVTVLTERGTHQQQRATRTILAAMGLVNPNVLVAYVASPGNTVELDYWGDEHE